MSYLIESTLLWHFGEYRSWKMTQCHVHCKLSRVKTIPDTTRSEVQTKTPKFSYNPFFWNLNNLVLRKDPFYIKKKILKKEQRLTEWEICVILYIILNSLNLQQRPEYQKHIRFLFYNIYVYEAIVFKRLLEHYHIATNAKTTILKNCLIPINIQL